MHAGARQLNLQRGCDAERQHHISAILQHPHLPEYHHPMGREGVGGHQHTAAHTGAWHPGEHAASCMFLSQYLRRLARGFVAHQRDVPTHRTHVPACVQVTASLDNVPGYNVSALTDQNGAWVWGARRCRRLLAWQTYMQPAPPPARIRWSPMLLAAEPCPTYGQLPCICRTPKAVSTLRCVALAGQATLTLQTPSINCTGQVQVSS